MTITEHDSVAGFLQLALAEPVYKAVLDAGYETPTPIQALTIPPILAGRDVVGQAQTGTGKTAAFALPLLSRIDLRKKGVQILVLAPTRELAIQVADSFKKYSTHIKGLKVLPIYGGQEYGIQLRALKRGLHVVIGTPGRVMDHMRRGTLSLENLSCLVLDEADEMLRMGFIDDVKWVLEQTPATRQIALFSATMPKPIRNIARRHLNDPEEIIIETHTTAADSIRQRYLIVSGGRKLEALIRILETEEPNAVLVFVRTKTATVEVAEQLVAKGHAACALNGDLSQALRERTLNQLKNGSQNIVVATDVAARGLDVDRISHVINYDAPFDAESYVHRIGRTGRAGKSGEAILFVKPKERRILGYIAKATKQKIEAMEIPSVYAINQKRLEKLNTQITDTLQSKDISFFKDIIEKYYTENHVAQIDVAAAVAHLLQGDAPMLLKDEPRREREPRRESRTRPERGPSSFTGDRPRQMQQERPLSPPEEGMDRYRIEVGYAHGVRPANIVGAIANEAAIGSEHIGRINIYDDYSTVDLPEGMPRQTLRILKKVWVCNTQLRIFKEGSSEIPSSKGPPEKSPPFRDKHAKPKKKKKRNKPKKDK